MFWNSLVFYKRKSNSSPVSAQGGFGLIELMVSITVMVIVSSIILVRQSSFNSAVLLRGQAYEIALSVRDVQLNAVSAARDSTGTFRSVLGVHFDYSSSENQRYKIFLDSDNDHFYDAGEETGAQGILDPRFEIRNILVNNGPIPGGGTELSTVFERPNFDAHFYNASNNHLNTSTKLELEISQRDSTGTVCGKDYRRVEITRSGQISVQECP